MVIMGVVREGYLWVATLAIIGAILTMLYLFRLFNGIFMGKEVPAKSTSSSRLMIGCVVFLGIISLAIGIFITQSLELPSIAVAEMFK